MGLKIPELFLQLGSGSLAVPEFALGSPEASELLLQETVLPLQQGQLTQRAHVTGTIPGQRADCTSPWNGWGDRALS